MTRRSLDDIQELVARNMEKAAEDSLEKFWFPNGRPEPTTWPPKQKPYRVLKDLKGMT